MTVKAEQKQFKIQLRSEKFAFSKSRLWFFLQPKAFKMSTQLVIAERRQDFSRHRVMKSSCFHEFDHFVRTSQPDDSSDEVQNNVPHFD